ncbi:hypothetical protein [Glycomyces buryatensis]|uniref:Uncharacterized protein n=1 Tax=Glycomyces buryatensis TaxID=2570927 RepID=A0A4S8QBH8_9ACTN|nr:hypothetical protein [Glycomyces buryatensis]THV41630.1 hypothetical protein FAB82_11055 [Glycomyces buryatensis]
MSNWQSIKRRTPTFPFRLRRELPLALLGSVLAVPTVLVSSLLRYFAHDDVRDQWSWFSGWMLVVCIAVLAVAVFFSRLRFMGNALLVIPVLIMAGAFLPSVPFAGSVLGERGVEVICHVESTRDRDVDDKAETVHDLDCGEWPGTSTVTAREDRLAVGADLPVIHDPWGRVDPVAAGEPDPSLGPWWLWGLAGFAVTALSVVAWLLIADDERTGDRLSRLLDRSRGRDAGS